MRWGRSGSGPGEPVGGNQSGWEGLSSVQGEAGYSCCREDTWPPLDKCKSLLSPRTLQQDRLLHVLSSKHALINIQFGLCLFILNWYSTRVSESWNPNSSYNSILLSIMKKLSSFSCSHLHIFVVVKYIKNISTFYFTLLPFYIFIVEFHQ